MRALRAKLDDCMRRHPAMGLIVAASLSERTVLLQRTRAEAEAAAAAANASTDDVDMDDYLAATSGSTAGAAVRQATDDLAGTTSSVTGGGGGGGGSSTSVPPPKLVDTYVALAAECALPFSDAFDPKTEVEWSVARFYPAGWEVAVYRDTARQMLAGAADGLSGGAGGVPAVASDGTSPLDFILVAFSRLDASEDRSGDAAAAS